MKFSHLTIWALLTMSLYSADQKAQKYFPPYFDDGNRLTKIQAFLPEVDRMYREFAKENHIPGYAYGILLDGELIFSGSGGYSNLDQNILATPQSMFRIASMTKSFIALALLKLRDEGKIRFDDPVSLYIPEMQHKSLLQDGSCITIRDLLTHSAGFPTDDPWADRKLDSTDEELIQLVNSTPLFSNPPGVQFEYSNLGYTLLGYLIKKVTGIPYEDFVRSEIFEPLGMKDISWDYTQLQDASLARGYRREGEQWKEEPLLSPGTFGAMGGLITSVETFSRYMALHQKAWPAREEEETGPVRRSSLREAHQLVRFEKLVPHFQYSSGSECALATGYGYGLRWIRDSLGRVFVGHSGGLPGFGCHWSIMPDYGIGVVFLTNATYAKASLANLNVLDAILTHAQLAPRHLPPSEILLRRKEELLKLFSQPEKSVPPIFAQNFFLDHSLDIWKKEMNDLLTKAGKVTSVGELIAENQLRGSFVIRGEFSSLKVSFGLSPESSGLIQELEMIQENAH